MVEFTGFDGKPGKLEDQSFWWTLLEEIDSEATGLSSWEIDFVEGLMKKKVDRGAKAELTAREKLKIEEIHGTRM